MITTKIAQEKQMKRKIRCKEGGAIYPKHMPLKFC